MGLLVANNVRTTLASGIAAGDTSLSVTSASGMPSMADGDWFYATISDPGETVFEIVKVTGLSGTSLTATRGQDGTTAASWPSGSVVSIRPVAQIILPVGTVKSCAPYAMTIPVPQKGRIFPRPQR